METTSKSGRMGLGTGFPCFVFDVRECVAINPANAPAEILVARHAKRGRGRVALGTSRYGMVVWYRHPRFGAHGDKWQDAAGRERHQAKS
jgi:hypothetical protein